MGKRSLEILGKSRAAATASGNLGVLKTHLKDKRLSDLKESLKGTLPGAPAKLSRNARKRRAQRQLRESAPGPVRAEGGPAVPKVAGGVVPLRFHVPKPKVSGAQTDAEIDDAIVHADRVAEAAEQG